MTFFADNQLPVAGVLSEACSPSFKSASRAMARNLLCEHRLSVERFAEFSASAGEITALDGVQQALEEYQIVQVRPTVGLGVSPAYARPDNKNNSVELAPGAHVGTVLDLTRLGRIYAEAKAVFKMSEFQAYAVTDPRDHSQVNEFLASQLSDPALREVFLKALFRAWTRYRRRIEQRVHPTWVAEWRSLEPFLDRNIPERWLQAVGVPRDYPVWLAVLRYPVENRARQIKLFRPTQIDAGWYAHHFPSPPQAGLASGGHTMFLGRPDQGIHSLVSEFLHVSIDFTIRDWHRADNLVGFARQAVTGGLEQQRNTHWQLLQSSYGAVGVRAWMPECL